MDVTRRRCLSLLVLATGAPAALAQPGLPQRNLRIEWRQGDEAALARQGTAAGGSVVVSSSRGVHGGVTVQATRRESVSSGGLSQQVLVLNGGRASVRLARTEPLQWYEVAWNARDGATLVPTTVLLEAGRGFTVQPRWPGGAAPVTLEIAAETGPLPADRHGAMPPAAREDGTLLTTLQVPLGEWVTVASTADAQQVRERRGWSSVEARSAGRSVLQVRVSLP